MFLKQFDEIRHIIRATSDFLTYGFAAQAVGRILVKDKIKFNMYLKIDM